MIRNGFIILFLVNSLLIGWSADAQDKRSASRANRLESTAIAGADSFLRAQIKQRRIPGMQVAVIQKGKLVLLKAYGLANVEDSIPVTDQTLFPVHSITKAFVGVALMQLVEAGKVVLSAPIKTYLDSLPPSWQAITVRQLMTHTSGLPDIEDNTAQLIDNDIAVAWSRVQQMPVLFAPGQDFKYTATNYILIGKLLDKLGGEPFVDFITRHQFAVAGMSRSGFGDSHDVVAHTSGSYWYFRNENGRRVATDKLQHYIREWPPLMRTAVGLNTTAQELAQWVIALQGGQLLKKESLTALWTPGLLNDGSYKGFSSQLNGYALGWPVAIRAEHRVYGPTGGGRAALFIYPDDELSVIILTNLTLSGPQSYIDNVAGYFMNNRQATK